MWGDSKMPSTASSVPWSSVMGFLPQGAVMYPAIIFVNSPPPGTRRVIIFLSSFFPVCVLSISLLVKSLGPTMTTANRDRVENAGKTLETTLYFFPYKTDNIYYIIPLIPLLTFLNKKRWTQAQLHIANIWQGQKFLAHSICVCTKGTMKSSFLGH